MKIFQLILTNQVKESKDCHNAVPAILLFKITGTAIGQSLEFISLIFENKLEKYYSIEGVNNQGTKHETPL